MQVEIGWKDWLANWFGGFGIDVYAFRRGIKGLPLLIHDYQQFKSQDGSLEQFPVSFSYPCPGDRFEESGVTSGHYFHQDLLVARKIFEQSPPCHVDVGSRLDGFVAHVASFRNIEVLDIRPKTKKVHNIVFHQFDLMNPAGNFVSYCESLSCLHTLEHLGLGRYNDHILVDGHEKGFDTLWSILKPGGKLYLSVPIGRQRIEFNAHRVFAIRTILALADDKFDLLEFSYVDDEGSLHERVQLTDDAIENSLGCWYGCGIFEFRKIM
jgi:SAM-dependent methyltransferase